jgi:predicted TIM-barrel fold metal-dependent hydrolase
MSEPGDAAAQQSTDAAGPAAASSDVAPVYASLEEELASLRVPDDVVLDAHTHIGRDEDGQALDADGLLAALDEVGPGARAVAFPFHDPERHPAYRLPNDRVLAWAADSGGRIVPYCRLDPADDPIPEAERCLARGARGIKLHPRAQGFGFDNAASQAIFATARDAGVPILVHAGRGMPGMRPLAELALRFPEVTLVLAHTALADQGMFASVLRDHPNVLYDTSCFSPFDLVELFALVPAERIVFASDVPYGRPIRGLYVALRAAALAGLDDDDRALLAGGTMAAALEGGPLPEPRAPRLESVRAVDGTLLRIASYLMMAFGAAMAGREQRDLSKVVEPIALARCVCRDPDPGAVAPVVARIDEILSEVEPLLVQDPAPSWMDVIGLMHYAVVIAATEPLPASTPA